MSTTLQCDGITLDIPTGWTGQVIPLDYRGRRSMIRAANFPLPSLDGFAALPDLPPGVEDPIKGIGPGGAVLSVIPTNELLTGSRNVLKRSMVQADGLRSPRGRSIAEMRIAVAGRDIGVDVLFGSRQPTADALAAINTMLASLR